MSMYNLVHGENRLAIILLAMIGKDRIDVPRYRDCYWNGSEICLYTRLGGGNREDYVEAIEKLRKVPGYLRDEDDDFDCTYATFYYKPLEVFDEFLSQTQAEDATPDQRWQDFMEKLQSNKDDPQVVRVMSVLAPTFEAIIHKLSKK